MASGSHEVWAPDCERSVKTETVETDTALRRRAQWSRTFRALTSCPHLDHLDAAASRRQSSRAKAPELEPSSIFRTAPVQPLVTIYICIKAECAYACAQCRAQCTHWTFSTSGPCCRPEVLNDLVYSCVVDCVNSHMNSHRDLLAFASENERRFAAHAIRNQPCHALTIQYESVSCLTHDMDIHPHIPLCYLLLCMCHRLFPASPQSTVASDSVAVRSFYTIGQS